MEQELQDGIMFIVKKINLVNYVLSPIQKLREDMMSNEEIKMVIILLKIHWYVQRQLE